jgi:iron complex outermembrane receptor protein
MTAKPSAQQAAAPGNTLQEVVVTAQRREQSVQKTALAITAVTGADLTRGGVTDVDELSKLAPSVQIIDRGSGVNIAIRGVVTANPNPQGDPSLALNIDDVYVSRPQASNGIFYDIDRVEVLRGPQGTVYGRNATAGAINVISNNPANGFDASAAAEIGNYGLYSFSGMLNVPVNDTLLVRGAFQTLNHTGYIGGNFDDADDVAARLKVLWKPTSDIDFLLTGSYFHKAGHGTGDVLYPVTDKNDPFANTAYPDGFGHWNENDYAISGKIDYSLHFATLTYIGAYRELNDRQYNAQNGALGVPEIYTADQVTQEIRLASNTHGNDPGTLKWIAGLYYFNEQQSQFGSIEQPLVPKTYAPVLLKNTFEEPLIFSESYAAFGQSTYSLTSRLRLTVGARYTHDIKAEKGAEYISIMGNSLTFPAVGNPHFSNVSWKAGAEFDLTSSVLAFFNASTGYHAGGVFEGPPPADTYKPEHITSYEGGVKSRLLRNTLQLNADVYYYDYTNYQSTQLIPPFIVAVFNAQKAKATGIEVEGAYLLTRTDVLNTTVSWEDASFVRFFVPSPPYTNNGTGVTVPGGFQFDGDKLPLVSKWSGNIGYQHIFHLPQEATLAPGLSSSLRSSQTDFNARIGGFTRSDATLTYISGIHNWQVLGYVRNIEGKADASAVSTLLGNSWATLLSPRTYGIRFSAHY